MNASATLSQLDEVPDDVAPLARFRVGLHTPTMAYPDRPRFYVREVATGAIRARQLRLAEVPAAYCELAGIPVSDFGCRHHAASDHCGNCA